MSYNKKIYNHTLQIKNKYDELNLQLEQSANDYKKVSEINKILKNIEKIVLKFNQYQKHCEIIDTFPEFIKNEKDLEMLELMKIDYEQAKKQVVLLEEEIKILLLPSDPNDSKNIIVEIRPAAGGDEASIFCGNMFEAYSRYAANENWKIDILETVLDTHGYSFISFMVSGENVYSKMKYESGVHRVQRVPETESKGRVHTSTITVAILPEVEDIDVTINPDDIREDRFHASGAGGQHVNKTESAIRLTHIPTGIVVACQEGKSQHSNRDKAMKMLKSKIYDLMLEQQHGEQSNLRKNQVGSGERSEKIRTYNYPQNRVTDHRIGFTINKLDSVMQGYLSEIINALISNEQNEKLKQFEF